MEDYGLPTYGDRIADAYDAWVSTLARDTEGTVEFLADVAGAGPVLELGVGTGRVSLPLAARGLDVHGIDASEAMVAKLREKPGGEAIPVTVGDFADVGVEGRYSLVFVVFTTFFALLTQDDQVRCFRNVAEHLTDDGAFLVEVFVPDLGRFHNGEHVSVRHVRSDAVVLDASLLDAAAQRVDAQLVELSEGGTRLWPVALRFAWPSELDLMARLAGLRLRERWSDWDRSPFDAKSAKHISVYERARWRSAGALSGVPL